MFQLHLLFLPVRRPVGCAAREAGFEPGWAGGGGGGGGGGDLIAPQKVWARSLNAKDRSETREVACSLNVKDENEIFFCKSWFYGNRKT